MVNVAEQLRIFIACTAAGFAAGTLYDFCTALKGELGGKIFSAVTDAAFWAAVLYGFFKALTVSGKGQLRGFALMAFAVGFGIYYVTLSRGMSRWMVISVSFAGKIIRIITAPFKLLLSFARQMCKKTVGFVQNIQKNRRKFVKNRLEKKQKIV